MFRAVLADVLTGGRVVLGIAIVGALITDRVNLFSILLSLAWASDVFDGRLARSSGRRTLFGETDMLIDTVVGVCVLLGLALSDRAPLGLVLVGIVVLGALYLRTRNPAISQVLQGVAYGGALWLILRSPDATLLIPLGTLGVLMLLEYRKFFDKVLPMFFHGIASFVKGEPYEGPTIAPFTDHESPT
jgi:phosphatidylglycerophosphate synthase